MPLRPQYPHLKNMNYQCFVTAQWASFIYDWMHTFVIRGYVRVFHHYLPSRHSNA